MKSARQSLVIALAFITMLSALNTTAFAQETADIGSASGIARPAEVILEAPAVNAVETAPSYNASSGDTAASGNSTPASDDTTAVIATTDTGTADAGQSAESPDQASATAPASQPPAQSNPGIVLSAGQEIAVLALKYNGFKYVYGAASPSVGFDCSGLAYYVCNQFMYTLPRTARLQYQGGTAVEKANLQAGDLVFFATNGGRSVSHVGFYVGNDEFIHAATSRHGVMISSLDNSYWSKAWVGAKRIVSSETN